jgi:hypothetical protein
MSLSIFEKSIFNPIRNCFRNKLLALRDAIVANMSSDLMDKILEMALNAMCLMFKLLPAYRKKIKGFKGKIAFKSKDEGINVTAVFKRVGIFRMWGLQVLDTAADDANVTLTFRNGSAMADFLLSGNPDIIAGILDKKLSFSGNVNYLFRFVYIARHLPVELGIQPV